MKNKPLIGLVVIVLSGIIAGTVLAASITSSVIVGNSAPTVSSVIVNGGSNITLTPNATTSVSVGATVNDNNGCGDLTGGTTTILLYQSAVGSSTCLSTPNNLNCYVASVFTASSTCVGAGTSINTTTTFGLYYFAKATDSSSTASSTNWMATVIFKDPSNATGSNDSPTGSTPDVLTLSAINVTTSSINYSTIGAGSNTGVTNQTTLVTNAGNSTTTLQLSASQTLTSGGNVMATSSQVYSTSTFTYPGTSTQLTSAGVTVGGFSLTGPTSTTNVSSTIFWGLGVPPGTPAGTYTGTNAFGALFTQ